MSRKSNPPYFRTRVRAGRSASSATSILLDSGTIESLRSDPKRIADLAQFTAALAASFAAQRASIQVEIDEALGSSTKKFAFTGWQRRVKVAHQMAPLSAAGSRISFIGGRFNVGSMAPSRFQPFPGLYLAEDQATAHSEILGEQAPRDPTKLADVVFSNVESYAMYAVSGEIQECLDITDDVALVLFLNCIKTFKVAPDLLTWAKRINVKAPVAVTSMDQLRLNLLHPDWRLTPTYADQPSDSQDFGSIVVAAGIEAIRYPSVRYPGKSCLVVYPQNFKHSTSWVSLDDPVPPGVITRLDKTTFPSLM